MIRGIWNPWHGCKKKSEGCEHCYMYFTDKTRGLDGGNIYRVKKDFDYPIHKDRHGDFKVKSGQTIRVCLTSDFFLEEADEWRKEAWNIISQRPDVIFSLLTKRPERIKEHLPKDWGDGWDNVMLNVTMENQKRVDERMPILLALPFKHKGIFCAPFLGPIDLEKYLVNDCIERIVCDGEYYDGYRPLHYEWVESLSNQAKKHNITFIFGGIGNKFIKDGKEYNITNRSIQVKQAIKSNLNYTGKEYKYELKYPIGIPLTEDDLYKPYFHSVKCKNCTQKFWCEGCSECGKCEK